MRDVLEIVTKKPALFSKRLYSPKEVALMLGVSTQALYLWRKQRRGPGYIDIGQRGKRSRILYRGKDIIDFLESRFVKNN